MGHVTALASTVEDAKAKAHRAASVLHWQV
jgi:hypothetical protein